ncbi:MAG: DUF6266 family protein [Fermentimonas sp.]|nr:DUF6266 family protein [Fermentimonas sp.]
MGKIDLNKMGLSGRIGPVIAYVTKGGKQAFRQYTVPSDPKTPKQLASRMRFGLANSALAPLNSIIKHGYKDVNNAFRSAVSMVLKNAVTGEYPNYSVDYSKIQIAGGKLQPLTGVTATVDKDSGTVHFNWDPQPEGSSLPAKGNDQVNIACLNTAIPEAVNFINRAKRSDGSTTIDLNRLPGIETTKSINDLHFWVYLTSGDLKSNSDSVYVKTVPLILL